MVKRIETDPVELVQNFVAMAEKLTAEIYVGIDPGSQGAIAFICDKFHIVVDIPTIKVSTKRTKKTSKEEQKLTGHKSKTVEGFTTKFNFTAICQIFRPLKAVRDRVVVCLEEVPTSLGPGKRHAEIMLNRAWAIWPLFLCVKGYIVEDARPAAWKKMYSLIGKNKAASRHKALSLFPKARTALAQAGDSDRAEALLIAQYVKTLRAGGQK